MQVHNPHHYIISIASGDWVDIKNQTAAIKFVENSGSFLLSIDNLAIIFYNQSK